MVADRETSNEELLQLAIKAAKGGQKEGARVMLRQIYTRDRRNEAAMMWLAKLAKTDDERKQWLRRILDSNPDNKTARKALDRMQYQRAAIDNRTLLVFGSIVAIMIVLLAIIFLVIVLS